MADQDNTAAYSETIRSSHKEHRQRLIREYNGRSPGEATEVLDNMLMRCVTEGHFAVIDLYMQLLEDEWEATAVQLAGAGEADQAAFTLGGLGAFKTLRSFILNDRSGVLASLKAQGEAGESPFDDEKSPLIKEGLDTLGPQRYQVPGGQF